MSDAPSTDPATDGSPGPAGAAELERVDWDRIDGSGSRLTAERIALVAGLLAVVGIYLYYRARGNIYLTWRWNVGGVDWLAMIAVAVLLAYVVVPLGRNRRNVRRLLSRFRAHPATVLALSFLAAMIAVGAYGVVGFGAGELTTITLDRFQPPVWETVPYEVTQYDCTGEVPEGFDRSRPCHGTWEFPLGTDRWGYDMIDLLIAGARPLVYITAVTAGLIVPLATVVGLVSGYVGGRSDDVLMGYVDAQLAVPAILVYLLAYMFVGNSMFVLVVAFGLLSWGGIARIVRSETLQRREEGYVLSARAVGAPAGYVLRRHLLPNVTNTVVPATFHLLAVLVLTEAGLAFLGFYAMFHSWGMTIAEGLYYVPQSYQTAVWWPSALPALALGLSVAAFKVAGDGLRDVLDPRWEP